MIIILLTVISMQSQQPELEKKESKNSDLTISVSGPPWLRSNPRLWLNTDIPNHSDLILLDGAIIPLKQAADILEIYDGAILLDDSHIKIKSDKSSGASLTYGSVSDQNYCLTRYGIEYAPSRSGTISWIVEGFHIDLGWVTIDSQKFITESLRRGKNMFILKNKLAFDEFRITFSPSIDISLIGISLYGREEGLFHIPYIAPPNEEFSWVATLKDLGSSIYHEDIGDLGWSSVPASSPMWPANRLKADGRLVSKDDEPKLFAAIGHSQDKLNDTSRCRVDVSSGIFDGRSWGSDHDGPVTIDILIPNEQSLGYYSMPAHRNRKPRSWKVEVFDDTLQDWVVIDEHTDVTSEDYTAVDGIFFVPITEKPDIESRHYRITITEWNQGSKRVGLMSINLFVHPANKFYLPTMEAPGRVGYVVRDNRSANIINLTEQGENLKKFFNESNNRIDASIDKVNFILNNTQLKETDES